MWLQYQQNVYIGKLDDRVNECNNTYHSTTKMRPADVTSRTYIDFDVENDEKIMQEYENIKLFLEMIILQIVLKKFLRLKKSKNTVDKCKRRP